MGVKIRHRETGEERTLLNGEYTTFAKENPFEVAEFWQVVETDAILSHEQSIKYAEQLHRRIASLEQTIKKSRLAIGWLEEETEGLCREIVDAVFHPTWGCRFPKGNAATAMVKAAITIRTRSGGTLDNALKSAFDILGGETENRYDGGDDEDDD